MTFDVWSIIILVLAVIGLIAGLSQGFIKQLKFIFGFLGAAVVAVILFKIVYAAIAGTSLLTTLNSTFENMFIAKGDPFTATVTEATYADTLSGALTALKLPAFVTKLLASKIPWSADFEGLALGVIIGDGIAKLTLKAGTFLVILIVAWIVLAIVWKLLKKVMNFKILKPVDKILGLVVGVAKVLIIVCLLFWGITFLMGAVPSLSSLLTKIVPVAPAEGSFSIGWYLYNQNPLAALFGKIL